MKSFDQMLSDYAKMCVEIGINIQKNQPLVISAPIEGAKFVRMVAKHAYEKGASNVHINWTDDYLTRLKYDYAPLEVFENFPKWKKDMMIDFAEQKAGFLSIYSEDPELLKGVDSKKINTNNRVSSENMKEFRNYTMNDINPWCVVSIPTEGWAKKVFPNDKKDDATNKLWHLIFEATSMNLEKPVLEWQNHIETLQERVDFLNGSNFSKLIYKSSNGTNLEVELPKNHIWAGGGSYDASGTYFVANMPTEEVFTMPKKDGVNGVVYSTMPLNYSGNLIENFKLRFKDGEIIDFDAEKNKHILEELLNMDEGSKYLGEVALVPYDSPISNLKTIFYNTLFDENASCHFAFGKAYPTNIKDGEKMTKDELLKNGVNDSIIHEDFMVGSKDLNITGVKDNGEEVEIFKNGNWA